MFDEILNGLEKLLADNSTTRLDTAFFELVLKRLESFGYTAAKEDGWLMYYIGASVEQKIKNECNTAAIPGGLLYKAVDMVCGEFLYQKFNSGQADIEALDLEQMARTVKIGDVTVEYGDNAVGNEAKFTALVDKLRELGDCLCYRRLRW